MDVFWMCWVIGTEGAKKRYVVKADARAEAERLALVYRKEVYLLESVDCLRQTETPLIWESTMGGST